jgi:hypothetical protein
MIDEQKINKSFDDFEAAVKSKGATVATALPAAVDACGVWHSIRGTVDTIINGLKAIGSIFPIAKKAADVLDTLKNLLNTLCP